MNEKGTMLLKPKAARKLLGNYTKLGSVEDDVNLHETGGGFKFPPPPKLAEVLRPKTWNWSGSDADDTSDSQNNGGMGAGVRGRRVRVRGTSWAVSSPPRRPQVHRRHQRGYQSDGSPITVMPPIGVFWDIENCQIPRGKSAVAVAQAIRDKFFEGYREAEFIVVCDVKKEHSQIIKELNDAQVNLIHVDATSKNAADEKLRHSMRRFADLHGFPAALVLISGDINFAPDVCDLRHRKKLHIILLHTDRCSESLIVCANEHYLFGLLVENLPLRNSVKENQTVEVMVSNLPDQDEKRIWNRLKMLSANCGGRVGTITQNTTVIRFTTFASAKRAQKRLDGEIVFGNQISVGFPQRIPNRKDQSSVQSDGLVSQYIGVNSNNFAQSSNKDSVAWFPNNSIGHWNEFTEQWSKGYGVQNVPIGQMNGAVSNQENIATSIWDQSSWFWKGNCLELEKGRPVLAARNEKNNTQEKILSQNSSIFYKGNDIGYNVKTPVQRNSNINPCIDNNSEKIDSLFKRSKVTSPKLQSVPKTVEVLRPNGRNIGTGRTCRMPSPYAAILGSNSSSSQNSPTNFSRKPEVSENDRFFNPIPAPNHMTPIELHVYNLDQSIEPMEMKKILLSAFGEHVMVLHVSVFMQSDGNFAASVKVPTLPDAQYAISQLHRLKVGFKRIMISYAHSSHPHNPQFIRWQIVSLLQEVPGHKLPLFKFHELFESRYVSTVSVSDLYRLRDVCIITESSNGRMVSLNPDHRNTPSPNLSSQASFDSKGFTMLNANLYQQIVNYTSDTDMEIEPFCMLHYKGTQSNNKGWAEQEAAPLPNLNETLPHFSNNIHKLLNSHNSVLQISSICNCYEAECGPLNVSEVGVPMEHLVTCVNGVELAISNGVKYLRPAPPRSNIDDNSEDVSKCVSPSLVFQINLLGREIVDLLKMQHHCQLMFNRFIPAYHHHFGRQCRVADYGFTKLIELLEALPNVVQVLGEGNKRIVTLSYRAQMRRFTSDLLRVLKGQPSKQMSLGELPQVFERALGRPFDPIDYGLCRTEDLVAQLSQNTVIVSGSGDDTLLAIPKREQTSEEIERTKEFSKELDEDSEGERRVSLTHDYKLKVLGDQIFELVNVRYPPGLPLSSLPAAFLWQNGYQLKPENYRVESLEMLISTVSTVKIVHLDCGETLVPADQAQAKEISSQVLQALMDTKEGKMTLSQLQASFNNDIRSQITTDKLKSYLGDSLQMEDMGGEIIVSLNSVNQFGRRLYHLLCKCDGNKVSLSSLESAYLGLYSTPIQPAQYGYASLPSLLSALNQVVSLRGKGSKRMLILNKALANGKWVAKEIASTKTIIKNGNKDISYDSVFSLEDSSNASQNSWGDSVWSNSLHGYDSQVPVITLPQMSTPPANIMQTSSLISPCKNLLAAHPLHNMLPAQPIPFVMPPDPSELPMPDMMYLTPKQTKMEKEQNGCLPHEIVDTKECSPIKMSPMNPRGHNDTPNTANKRKLRLAAQFQTPIELS